jgi:hypothetical protein
LLYVSGAPFASCPALSANRAEAAATGAGLIDEEETDMADETRPALELEQDARTINPTD